MNKKYVIFKDDDAGINLQNLKRWIDIILEKNCKGTIGVIGKYLKNKELREYLNSLNQEEIEIFCHGFSHKRLPYIGKKMFKGKKKFSGEFENSLERHTALIEKYCEYEKKYLNTKAIAFGPQGNKWNENIIKPLIKNNFKMMFSWKNVGGGLLTIPLTINFRKDLLCEFFDHNRYEKNKNDVIYTVQFHHAKFSEQDFEFLPDIIDFLINKEGRISVTPSELYKISQKDEEIYSIMTSEK